jgi:hypothetical protein
MSYRDTYPLDRPAIRPAGVVGDWLARWWWPAVTLGGFLALVGYVAGRDPAAGLSDRALLALAAGLVVLVILTRRRRRYGARELARTLAEYAVVAALVGALVTLQPATSARSPARQPGRHVDGSTLVEAPRGRAPTRRERARPEPAQREQAPTLLDRAADVAGWVGDLWRQATEQASRSDAPTPSDRPGR